MDLSLIETKLIWATVRAIEPSSRHATLLQDGIPAWLIKRGRLRLRFEDEVTEAGAGQWIFPKRGTARHDFTDDAVILSLRFRLQWPSGEDLYERTRTLVVPNRTHGKLKKEAEALAIYLSGGHPPPAVVLRSPSEYFSRQATFNRWLENYSDVVASAGLRMRSRDDTDRRLLRVRALLDGRGLSEPIPRSDLASQVGWSIASLNRRFTAEYGMTPRRYFELRRFDWVRSELTRGKRIKEVAAVAGFSSLAQFSNWFNRLAGMSPRSYPRQVHV